MSKKYFVINKYLSMSFLLALCFILSSPSLAAERVPAYIEQGSMSMLGYFDWIIDSDGTLNIEDIQKEDLQKSFKPLKLNDVPLESGTVWLRFTIAARNPNITPHALLLDLGDSIPAKPTLYAPKYNSLQENTEWQTHTPTQQSVFSMPEPRATPTTMYISMDGMPGLWFSPTLRTPHNAATSLERLAVPAVIVALCVVMLLCLLRGLTERGQWRIWASLYTGVALFYAIWGVPPTARGYVVLDDMAAVIAPGVALILFSHVARHLMRSNVSSRLVDIQYLILCIPGIVVALMPLIPGYAWTVRYLSLWPLLTVIFVPTTLGAWLSGLPGARRFLIGTLFPPLGAALAYAGLQEPHFLPLPILETLPLWGIAISTLIIAGTTAPQEYARQTQKDQNNKSNTNQQHALDLNLDASEHNNDLQDPNLKVVNIDQAQNNETSTSSSSLEESLRWPVDQLLHDLSSLESCALSAAAREHVSSIVSGVRNISTTLSSPVDGKHAPQSMVFQETNFELQTLLRQAHDSVSPLADSKNIALSWFMPPHLSRRYKGDAVHLLFVLRLLLESSVRATNRGAVQLAVRRVPESVNPGHLLFTVTDTGTGRPPHERSVSALARAWELTASSHGFLGMESNAHGATISFTLNCEVATNDAKRDSPTSNDPERSNIIIVSDNDANRQLWSFFLEDLPYNMLEARNKRETLAQYAQNPAALIIFDTEQPSNIISQNISELQAYEAEHSLKHVSRLAIYADENTAEEYDNNVFSYSITMPITRSQLRIAVFDLLSDNVDENNEQIGIADDFESNDSKPQTLNLQTMQDELAESELTENVNTESEHLEIDLPDNEDNKNTEQIQQTIQTESVEPVEQAALFELDDDIELTQDTEEAKNTDPQPENGERDSADYINSLLLPNLDKSDDSSAQETDNNEQNPDNATVKNKSNDAYLTSLLDTSTSNLDEDSLPEKTDNNTTATVETVDEQSNASSEEKTNAAKDTFKPSITFSQVRTTKIVVPSHEKKAENTPEAHKITLAPQPAASLGEAPSMKQTEEEVSPTFEFPFGFGAQESEVFAPTTHKSTSNAPMPQENETIAPIANESHVVQPVPSEPVTQVTEDKAELAPSESQLDPMAQKLEAKLAKITGKPTKNTNSTSPQQDVSETAASKRRTNTPLQDLLSEIDSKLHVAKEGFKNRNTSVLAESAGHIAANAESFGLRTLGRLARTVESAANAGDLDALQDLFPELEASIERNRIALKI